MGTVEHSSSYEVVVRGVLRPAVVAFCGQPSTHCETTGAFQLRLRDGQGIAELAAMLQAASLVILSIRQVSQRETWAGMRLSP